MDVFGLILITYLTNKARHNADKHSCFCLSGVHGFIINDRLLPEAMNPDESGKNVCPVCLTKRPDPTNEDPGFVRYALVYH